ncbi:hypothetical protein P8452_57123 [Trifolium repens]|nr:hypothetical protein P8452_57123 [Trifolium repens]
MAELTEVFPTGKQFDGLMHIPTMMNEHDIEQAYDDDDHDHHERVTIFHTLLFTNLQAWTMVATIEEDDYDEIRGQKLRAFAMDVLFVWKIFKKKKLTCPICRRCI